MHPVCIQGGKFSNFVNRTGWSKEVYEVGLCEDRTNNIRYTNGSSDVITNPLRHSTLSSLLSFLKLLAINRE